MRGLIAGVLGGAARGYTQMAEGELKKQQELDLRTQLMEAETEKQLRIDEIKRNRDIADIPRKAEATAAAAPVLARGDAAAAPIRAEGEAAAAPIKARGEAAAAPIRAEGEAAAAPIKARGEAQGQIAKTGTPGYLGSVASETSAKESSGSKAQGALANFKLSQERAVADLRTQLSRTTDEGQRGVIEQQIKDLSGSSSKSYGDMVTAAGHYRMLAQNLRKDADMANTEGERTAMLERAMYYEKEADGILQATKDKRLGSDGKSGASTTTGSPREGQESVSKSGKPIVFRNGQWVYK